MERVMLARLAMAAPLLGRDQEQRLPSPRMSPAEATFMADSQVPWGVEALEPSQCAAWRSSRAGTW